MKSLITLLLLFVGLGLNAESQTKDLVVIDESIQDINLLKESTLRDAEILLVNEESEVWFEIYRIINTNSNIKQVHLLLPVKDGKLVLNNVSYDQNTIGDVFDIKLLKNKNISLLFYGSNFACQEQGKALINKISELTNLKVAASETKTAGENAGGDWGLEYQTSADLVFEPIFNEAALKDYPLNF
ncbi:DUF4347 domain-containing protein [Saccharicrinis sp. FJH54]|uniref:DUF4347 domain-containing protein n=1 Tax=Saccharicrinis sp. FJH54 TaxID=3344665 RepID=UPI0035D4694D